MDLFFLFFQFGTAIKLVFEISYIPQREDFKELTHSQYQAMYTKVPEEDLKTLSNQKILAFLPDDPKVYSKVIKLYGNNLLILGEEEIPTFEATAELIEKYCSNSGRSFESLSDKLVYMAQILPEVFSEGTPYAIHGKLGNFRK